MILTSRARDYVARPRNAGPMEDANRVGTSGTPGEGPYITIWLKVDSRRILQATYECNGCPSSIASASALCELATGREMDKMQLIDAHDLVNFLGGLPEGKGYYADMAVQALKSAMEDK